MNSLFDTGIYTISNKAYEMLLSYRPYKTEIKKCDCFNQECKGKFLIKVGSLDTVCLFELRRLNYINNIAPVMKLIEERITL